MSGPQLRQQASLLQARPIDDYRLAQMLLQVLPCDVVTLFHFCAVALYEPFPYNLHVVNICTKSTQALPSAAYWHSATGMYWGLGW